MTPKNRGKIARKTGIKISQKNRREKNTQKNRNDYLEKQTKK